MSEVHLYFFTFRTHPFSKKDQAPVLFYNTINPSAASQKSLLDINLLPS